MTRHLYDDRPYDTEFQAHVVERRPLQNGVAIVLDETLFYPTSGGQPCDLGTIDDVPVLDVIAAEDGTITHVLPRDVAGPVVHGKINWSRRLDHMQQHTGQHILSAAFEQIGAATVSFHLGAESATIDLDRPGFSAEEMAQAEQIANRVVLENRPITARFYADEEVRALPLRKPPTKTDHIRIVVVRDFDYSPCGGTHLRATGEVGPIKIRRWERRGQETRVEFLCGWRALRDYAWKHDALMALANIFSVQDREVVTTVTRLAEQAQARQRELETLQNRMLDYEAEELSAAAITGDSIRLVQRIFADRDIEEVRRLALRLSEKSRHLVLFGVSGDKGRLVLARSADTPGDMAALLKAVSRAFGGGGGGQPHLAQGGGMDASRLEEALHYALTTYRTQMIEKGEE